MRRSRSLVVIYTPISAPTVTTQPEFSSAEYYDAQPEFNNAPLPEYYDSNRDPNFIGTTPTLPMLTELAIGCLCCLEFDCESLTKFRPHSRIVVLQDSGWTTDIDSHYTDSWVIVCLQYAVPVTDAFSGGGNTGSGPPQYSSSDDDEVRSQPSSSLSSRSWSTPVPSDRPHLHTNSSGARERLRPRGRALARRPRCGLRMVRSAFASTNSPTNSDTCCFMYLQQ